MIKLFSLGKIYPADFLKPDEQPRSEPMELKLMMDDNKTVCLEQTPSKELMFGEKYWYRSSTSGLMRQQLTDIVRDILSVVDVPKGSIWLDIAGNDSFMLSQVPESYVRINIDPANDSYRFEAEKNCELVIQDYFSAKVYKESKYGNKKASIVSCISMFYDILDRATFLMDVCEIMDDNGIFVMQLSYSPLMLSQLEFSNVCHEHKFYYSFFNLKKLLEANGMKVMDVQLNNTNAGSFRLYVMKKDANENKFGSQTHRDVCNFRIKSLLCYEETLNLDKPETWMNFYDRINALKKQTVDFIEAEIKKGKVIYGYGASTKGATMLSYFGLDNKYITAIADRSPYKHGLRTVGTNINIVSEDEMRVAQPDYLFVMPFHFISEFVEREKEYLNKGGKMIVPLPFFQVITKDNI